MLTNEHQSYIPNTERIAEQNDAFRKAICLGITPNEALPGRAVTTRAVHDKGQDFIDKAVAAVGVFDTFDPDNDPDEHHDFGAFDIDDKRLFWKIDLFEIGTDMRYGAETPDDPSRTERVLTIMLASDW